LGRNLEEEVDSKVERKEYARQTVMRKTVKRIDRKRCVRSDREMQKNGREV